MPRYETLILRTVDGDDTLSVTEHPCADARTLLATLATGRLIVCSVTWCGRTMEVEVILA